MLWHWGQTIRTCYKSAMICSGEIKIEMTSFCISKVVVVGGDVVCSRQQSKGWGGIDLQRAGKHLINILVLSSPSCINECVCMFHIAKNSEERCCFKKALPVFFLIM